MQMGLSSSNFCSNISSSHLENTVQNLLIEPKDVSNLFVILNVLYTYERCIVTQLTNLKPLSLSLSLVILSLQYDYRYDLTNRLTNKLLMARVIIRLCIFLY